MKQKGMSPAVVALTFAAFVAAVPDEAMGQEPRPRFRYELEFGPLYTRVLDAQSPPESGTFLTLGDIEAEPTFTANIHFEWNFRERHGMSFFFAPLELRDFEPLTDEVVFGDVVFPPGKETVSRYRFEEYIFRYRYGLVNSAGLQLDVGGSLLINETRSTILQEELAAEVTEHQALPLAYLRTVLFPSSKLQGVLEAEGMRYSDTYRFSVLVALRVHWNRRWDFGIGYRGLTHKSETDDIRTKFGYDNVVLTVAFSF